jgi:hypothetical protein
VDYKALSYTWGTHTETKMVLCDGESPKITRSLYKALRQVREQEETSLLSVDALYINQPGDSEKTHQVRMMRATYQQATSVIVWLGGALEADRLGLDLLRLRHSRSRCRRRSRFPYLFSRVLLS